MTSSGLHFNFGESSSGVKRPFCNWEHTPVSSSNHQSVDMSASRIFSRIFWTILHNRKHTSLWVSFGFQVGFVSQLRDCTNQSVDWSGTTAGRWSPFPELKLSGNFLFRIPVCGRSRTTHKYKFLRNSNFKNCFPFLK